MQVASLVNPVGDFTKRVDAVLLQPSAMQAYAHRRGELNLKVTTDLAMQVTS